MIGNMRNSSVIEKIKCQKIDKFFYRNPEGTILKYSHYYVEKIVKQSLLIIMKMKNHFIAISIN